MSREYKFKAKKCFHCGHKFLTKASWQRHMEHLPHDTPYYCEECKRFFMNKVDLNHHQANVHQAGPFVQQKCSRCGTKRSRSRLVSSGVCFACAKHQKRCQAMVEMFGSEVAHISQIKQCAQEDEEIFAGFCTSEERRYRTFCIKDGVDRNDLSKAEYQKKYEDVWLDIKYKLLEFYKYPVHKLGYSIFAPGSFAGLKNRFGCDYRSFHKLQDDLVGGNRIIEAFGVGSSWGFLANELRPNHTVNKNPLYTNTFNEVMKVGSIFFPPDVSGKRRRAFFEDDKYVQVDGTREGKFTELPLAPLHKIARVAAASDVSTIPRLRLTCKEFSSVFSEFFQPTQAEIQEVKNIDQSENRKNGVAASEEDGSQFALYKEISKERDMLFFVEHKVEKIPIFDLVGDVADETYKCALYFPLTLALFPKQQIFQLTGYNTQNSIFHACHEICKLMVTVMPEIFEFLT